MSATTAPGTPAWLGAWNDRAALSLLLEHGPLSRVRMAELGEMSKPTASLVVTRLESAGLIRPAGETSTGPGRPAKTYVARADLVLGVAIDIDAKRIRACLVDAVRTVHETVELSVSALAHDRDAVREIRDAVHAACRPSGADPASVLKICIGVQGYLHTQRDDLLDSETLPGWPRTGVRELLENELGFTVQIDNDVNLAAVAERLAGSATDAASFALLWLGNGLGAAIDLEGTLFRGTYGAAGEIGFLPAPHGLQGRDGSPARDLQDVMGGKAMVRLAREHGVHGRGLTGILEALETSEARGGFLIELARRMAFGVVPLLAVVDPELVVLGGPTCMAGGAELAELVSQQIQRTSRWSPTVRASAVTGNPVLVGAQELLASDLREVLLGRAARSAA
ncbi:ROK family transcriptional regulator [Glaciibacter superstes]|uniref:ROK family transcriptional regulator n=1 Tax=Glaciibacter superstes TaxID=501023 RepID=UPI0003B75A34|nr:ROK family transcriptional regulator [Glaciibacter superstes]